MDTFNLLNLLVGPLGQSFNVIKKRGKLFVESDFTELIETQYESYFKRIMQIALQRFRDFINDNKAYGIYEHRIKPNQLTKDMMTDFVEYLQSRSKGEGAKSIYQRFKKVVNYAVDHGVMSNNPCKGVSITVDEQILRKDVLSLSEIEQLINTHYRYENPQVRNAFIFCLYTGLRFCDVKDLTYGNVDYQNKMHNFEQNGEDWAAYGKHCNSVESWMIHTGKLFVKRNERTDILS